jgi:UDP-N-acetylmuramoyl-L-alanyl-D-glutamate--2,6-diaminopimelate ligase
MTRRLLNVAGASRWLMDQARPAGGAKLRTDSRQVQPGDAFIAWPGQATDGRQFVGAALAAGASACLVEADGLERFGFDPTDDRIACLPGLKAATGELAAAWFGAPSERLQVIAVTGTNGKSSTAWWTAQALSALGRRCGLVGTLGIGEPPPALASGPARLAALALGAEAMAVAPDSIVPTGLTTPDPVILQAAFRRMVDAGFAACAIEASSIGLAEHRLAGTAIAVAQFTNFTRDHLDYHGDMSAYWAAKRVLFGWPELQAAVINVDDAQGEVLARDRGDAGLDLWTTSVSAPARLRAEGLGYVAGGLAFTLVEGETRLSVRSGLIGDYNVSNLLAALGALRALGVPLDQAAALVPRLTPVPGRMERVRMDDAAAPARASSPEVVIDYAHTPDALDKALNALRPLATERGGQLWCVFGCGGNRDATKRPMMGAIAHRLADRVVLTSDNPRAEKPSLILAQILAGICAHRDVAVIDDRRAAIFHAVSQAAAADVVLVAGKGHEDQQEVDGVKRPFLDRAVAAEALAARGAA